MRSSLSTFYKSAKTQLPKTNKYKGWKVSAIVAAAIIAIILGGWGILEYQYQQRLVPLSREVNNLWSDVIRPDGGIKVYSQHMNCPHWLDTTALSDNICPEVD